MAIITTAEAKAHLKIDHNDEDSLLDIYIKAANGYIKKFLNQPIEDAITDFSQSPAVVDDEAEAAIKAAALLTVGDLYENREGAGEKEVKENPAVIRLLHPYRIKIGI